MREAFGAEPDPWQVKALRALVSHDRIALQACKGPGKTCDLAWTIWWFMLFPDCNIAAISLSGSNVRNNLWKELAVWYAKSDFLKAAYQINSKRITPKDEQVEGSEQTALTWFCEARTWTREANDAMAGETLQGLHARYCMVVMDESGGMPDSLMIAARGIMANAEVGGRKIILQAGNPTRLEGPLYRAATKERSSWFVLEISGDPDDPDRSPRVDPKEARAMIEQWGRSHPFVLVNILGKFPPSSFNALVGPNEMSQAIGRHLRPSEFDRAAKIIGVDVARYGDDATVIWPRQGLAAFEPIVLRNSHPDDTAGVIAKLFEEWQGDAVMVDATGGFGDGVVDSLARIGITATRVQFAGKPIEAKYFNKRSEMLWKLAEWIKTGGAIAPGEHADRITEEMTIIEYTFRLDKVIMEDKAMVKVRLGRSPDYSDALACTFAFPVQPKERDVLAGLDHARDFNHAKTSYNPLERV